jgi:hypothetical protein
MGYFLVFIEQMLALHAQLAKAKTPAARASLQHQIDAADRQIDRLVYDLYGLTEEEIRIVEEATGMHSCQDLFCLPGPECGAQPAIIRTRLHCYFADSRLSREM